MIHPGPDPRPPAPPVDGSSRRAIELASYASFILIGWVGLFVPTLLRVLKDDFGRSDAEFGLVYLVIALLFAVGALTSGLIAGRMGRRVVVVTAALLIAGGMAFEAVAPAWPIFVVGAGLAGAGCGSIDALVSSVVMDLSVAGSGSGLNMLHLFYGVGALAAPLTIGALLGLGIDWRTLALATGLVGLTLAAPLARVGSVPPRPRPIEADADPIRSATARRGLRLALAALAIAIACYVAAENGLSSWLVGFLGDESMSVATLTLGLFWAGLATGRLFASRVADRYPPVRFTAACALVGGVAILVAVGPTSGTVRIGLFLVAGFAFGPVYPMIMAVAGSLFPHRAAAVAGIVTAAGVAGAITYPPLVGLVSGVAGLGAGMFGAAVLIFASGGAVVVAGRLAGRDDEAEPEDRLSRLRRRPARAAAGLGTRQGSPAAPRTRRR
jgi:fucose permease